MPGSLAHELHSDKTGSYEQSLRRADLYISSLPRYEAISRKNKRFEVSPANGSIQKYPRRLHSSTIRGKTHTIQTVLLCSSHQYVLMPHSLRRET